MGVCVVAPQDLCEFEFDGIAGPVSNGSLGTDRDDQVVFVLGSPLLDRPDYILADITREPLINRRNFGSETLQFVDRHGSNIQE